jgi:hypothetical protein
MASKTYIGLDILLAFACCMIRLQRKPHVMLP